MLDAFIIEELRRREEQEQARAEQPRLELPLEYARESGLSRKPREESESERDRGVVILDFSSR